MLPFEVFLEWWKILGPWLLGLLAVGAGLIAFILMEGIQALWHETKKRWWLILMLVLIILIIDIGISGLICVGAGVTPGSAVWGTLVVTVMLIGIALIADVRIVRRWIHQDKWPKDGIVRANMLNVRDKPDGAAYVRRLSRGDHVMVINQTMDWYQIGTNEWVAATYIELLS